MKSLLVIVFIALTVTAEAFAATAGADSRVAGAPKLLLDGSKLRLGSSNVLVLDAAAGHPIYSKAADGAYARMWALQQQERQQTAGSPPAPGSGDERRVIA